MELTLAEPGIELVFTSLKSQRTGWTLFCLF